MLEGKTVAVVVPAYDEETLVATTIDGVPDFVDRIFVVDDASRDATAAAAREAGDARVEVITHERNAGVGAAIVTGYHRAVAEGIDVTCVMQSTASTPSSRSALKATRTSSVRFTAVMRPIQPTAKRSGVIPR